METQIMQTGNDLGNKVKSITNRFSFYLLIFVGFCFFTILFPNLFNLIHRLDGFGVLVYVYLSFLLSFISSIISIISYEIIRHKLKKKFQLLQIRNDTKINLTSTIIFIISCFLFLPYRYNQHSSLLVYIFLFLTLLSITLSFITMFLYAKNTIFSKTSFELNKILFILLIFIFIIINIFPRY